jgi:hypothetical protein
VRGRWRAETLGWCPQQRAVRRQASQPLTLAGEAAGPLLRGPPAPIEAPGRAGGLGGIWTSLATCIHMQVLLRSRWHPVWADQLSRSQHHPPTRRRPRHRRGPSSMRRGDRQRLARDPKISVACRHSSSAATPPTSDRLEAALLDAPLAPIAGLFHEEGGTSSSGTAAELCGTTRLQPLRGSTDGGCQVHGRWRAETLGWCPQQRAVRRQASKPLTLAGDAAEPLPARHWRRSKPQGGLVGWVGSGPRSPPPAFTCRSSCEVAGTLGPLDVLKALRTLG